LSRHAGRPARRDCPEERLAFLKVDRRWDELRTDPRFVAIAQAMRLK